MIACKNDYLEIIKIFLKKCPNVINQKDKNGRILYDLLGVNHK